MIRPPVGLVMTAVVRRQAAKAVVNQVEVVHSGTTGASHSGMTGAPHSEMTGAPRAGVLGRVPVRVAGDPIGLWIVVLGAGRTVRVNGVARC